MCSMAPLVSLYAANSGWDCHSTAELTITMLPRVATSASAKTDANRSGASTFVAIEAWMRPWSTAVRESMGGIRKAFLSSTSTRPSSAKGAVDQRLARDRVVDVGRHREDRDVPGRPELLCGRLQLLGGPRGDDQPRALLDAAPGQRAAEPGTVAGEHDDTVAQQPGHPSILCATPVCRAAIRLRHCSGVTLFWSWYGSSDGTSSSFTTAIVGPSSGSGPRPSRCHRNCR